MATNPYFFLTSFILEFFFFFFLNQVLQTKLKSVGTPTWGQVERAQLLSAWTMDARPL